MSTFTLVHLRLRTYQASERPPSSMECPICSKPARELGQPQAISSYEGTAGTVRIMAAYYLCRWRHKFQIRWTQVPS